MTDPAHNRRPDDGDSEERDFAISEAERRENDPTKQIYGAYDDPAAAVENAEPARGDGVTVFELDGGDPMSDAIETQPSPPGVGPFPIHLVVLVLALVIFVALLVLLA